MNLELNEAGMTFLVGAFVLLGLEAVTYFVLGRHVTRFFEGRLGLGDDGTPASLTTGVFIGLSFAIGLLTEDVSFKYADPLVYRPFRFTYGVLHLAAADHDDSTVKNAMQVGVLVSELKRLNPRPTRLGRAVFSSGLFPSLLGAEGKQVEAWALNGGPLPLRPGDSNFETLESLITSAFYFAKNRVYNNEQYFDELRRIQSRLEFSATVATVGLLLASVAIVMASVRLRLVWRESQQRRLTARRGAQIALVFLAIYFFAYLAYVQESDEFNKRVFGYYDSMLRANRGELP